MQRASVFLGRLGVDPTGLHVAILGDAFYETRLIQNQLLAATGRRFLEGYNTDADQMRALMDNAAAQATGLNLALGVELTPEQVAALTSDILWLVEEEYMGQKALAPRLYRSAATHSGSNISVGNDLSMTAGRNMTIAGSGAAAGGDALLAAKNNLAVTSVQDSYNLSIRESSSGGLFGGSKKSTRTEDRVTNIASDIIAGGNLSVQAGDFADAASRGNIAVSGSSLFAGGDAQVAATAMPP